MSAQLPQSGQEMPTHIGPYLNLKHILSQIWLIHPIISILFVVFRLQLSAATAQDAVNNVKQDLLASCRAAEHAASSAASIPRYLAVATNKQIVAAVNGTLNAARLSLMSALTALEGTLIFIIDIFTGTFYCFFELLTRASVEIAMAAVNLLNTAISATANGLRTGIQSAISDAQNSISKLASVIHVTPPDWSVPSLDQLQNVQLPPDVMNTLSNLNNSLPSSDQFKAKFDNLVDSPFNTTRQQINETFLGLTFDTNALPIPNQKTVTFCDNMNTSMVDQLGGELTQVSRDVIYCLIGLIVFLLMLNALYEWISWKKKESQYNTIRAAADSRCSDHNLMWIESMMKYPKLTAYVYSRDMGSESKDKYFWFLRYILYPPAFACLLIGVFGIVSVEIQFAALAPLWRKYDQAAAASVSDLTNVIVSQMNASMYDDSANYANAVNTRIDVVQSTINNGLSTWITSTTSTLNTTIANYYSDMQQAVTDIFGNTPLGDPLQNFLQCMIGSKVDEMESALTFLTNNLHINIAPVNSDVLVLSPQTITEATQPIAQAALGSGNGQNDGFAGRILKAYTNSLEKERIMFAVFIGLWGFVFIMGIVIVCCHGQHQWRSRKSTGREKSAGAVEDAS